MNDVIYYYRTGMKWQQMKFLFHVPLFCSFVSLFQFLLTPPPHLCLQYFFYFLFSFSILALQIDTESPHETERERECDTDSSETAADSIQSNEGTIQPTWLIHTHTHKKGGNPRQFSCVLSFGASFMYPSSDSGSFSVCNMLLPMK